MPNAQHVKLSSTYSEAEESSEFELDANFSAHHLSSSCLHCAKNTRSACASWLTPELLVNGDCLQPSAATQGSAFRARVSIEGCRGACVEFAKNERKTTLLSETENYRRASNA